MFRKCLFYGPHCFSIPKEIIGRVVVEGSDIKQTQELNWVCYNRVYTAATPLLPLPHPTFFACHGLQAEKSEPGPDRMWEGEGGGVRWEEKKTRKVEITLEDVVEEEDSQKKKGHEYPSVARCAPESWVLNAAYVHFFFFFFFLSPNLQATSEEPKMLVTSASTFQFLPLFAYRWMVVRGGHNKTLSLFPRKLSLSSWKKASNVIMCEIPLPPQML